MKEAKQIIWNVEKRKISDLVLADYNPRKISDKGNKNLEDSVEKFGRVEPIAINTDNTVIGGHMRLGIYAKNGVEEVDVVIPSRQLTKKEEKELNLRLNKNVGEWDWAKMGVMGTELLLEIGFDPNEIKMGIGLSAEGDVDVDDSRMTVLTVLPPESPELKNRAQIHFDDIKQYNKVKKYIEESGTEEIIKILIDLAK